MTIDHDTIGLLVFVGLCLLLGVICAAKKRLDQQIAEGNADIDRRRARREQQETSR